MEKNLFDELKYNAMASPSDNIVFQEYSEIIYDCALHESFNIEVMLISNEDRNNSYVYIRNENANFQQCYLEFNHTNYEEILLDIITHTVKIFLESSFRHHRHIVSKIVSLIYELNNNMFPSEEIDPQIHIFKDIYLIEDYIISVYSRLGKLNYPDYEENVYE